MQVKILIADDCATFREVLKSFVAKVPETRLAKEAAGDEAAVQLDDRLKPDLVLMDIEMPRMDGLEATRLIKAQSTPTKVVLPSALADEAQSKRAADCGADGFLAKGTRVREMIAPLRKVATHSSKGLVLWIQFLAEEGGVGCPS